MKPVQGHGSTELTNNEPAICHFVNRCYDSSLMREEGEGDISKSQDEPG